MKYWETSVARCARVYESTLSESIYNAITGYSKDSKLYKGLVTYGFNMDGDFHVFHDLDKSVIITQYKESK